MSPASTTRSEFMPSTSTATHNYIIKHTHPNLTSTWAIIALTFVVIVVSGVLCYSIYSCYHSAVYQQQLEITESIRQRANHASKDQSAYNQSDDDLTGRRSGFKAKRLILNRKRSNSVATSQSSSTMPDITSPPLAVTYSTHTPYMYHASPISPLRSTEYESVQLSPGLSTPMYLDSNSIPYYIPEIPGSPLINSKLAPMCSSFKPSFNCSPFIFPPLTHGASTFKIETLAKFTAVCPRPQSTSAQLSRTRSASLVNGDLNSFARAAPLATSVDAIFDLPGFSQPVQDRKQSSQTFEDLPGRSHRPKIPHCVY
ncbi:hypothetical protein J3R30DRAFT_3685515 [Lentinula aciculospora]|uniref:Uncharacterized protein n=1 Tax=Lentinula aciculospora TaxID=153920 RepID=A0A9W9A119_9AGAR|nr:hypothetical protein J3R30DRAFT_3685515 [Lentinula aciculospora]